MARKQSQTKLDRMLTLPTGEDLFVWSRRLDEAVDKFADATANLSVTLARHGQRLDMGDKIVEDLKADYKLLDKKIDTQTETLKAHIDETLKPIQTKISRYERWRWMVVGVVTFITAVAGVVAFIYELFLKP